MRLDGKRYRGLDDVTPAPWPRPITCHLNRHVQTAKAEACHYMGATYSY
jgi:hypothetical protein